MDFEMYGIGCAFCGRAVESWRDGRTWPCCCPTPDALRRPAARPLVAPVAVAAPGPRRPLPRTVAA